MKFVEHYSAIKELKPAGLRGRLRDVALDGLSLWDKFTGSESALAKPRVQFLYIHHVFKDEERNLATLLDRLGKDHAFISYADAVNRILGGTIDKPYICISSDDGFKNNVRSAEIMAECGIKACYFINPPVIGPKPFGEIEEYCRTRLHFPPVEFMDWQDIEKVQGLGHEIGSHTMDHINVAATNRDAFAEDCRMTFELLQSRCGEAKHFAFPYGRFSHFSETGRQVVFDAGFISCASAERGCHVNPPRVLQPGELCIRRDHIVLDWDIDHILHFLVNNARNADPSNNAFVHGR